jgi:4-O-beta-D-mannosyl-D-glucose phosphorylase
MQRGNMQSQKSKNENMKVGSESYAHRLERLRSNHHNLVQQPNEIDATWDNGVFNRYAHCVLTAQHVPLEWRFDFNESRNPRLMERLGVNAVFNSGAIEHNGKFLLVTRIEGYDRKSFFAIAESETGIDRFTFRDQPILFRGK